MTFTELKKELMEFDNTINNTIADDLINTALNELTLIKEYDKPELIIDMYYVRNFVYGAILN